MHDIQVSPLVLVKHVFTVNGFWLESKSTDVHSAGETDHKAPF